VGALAGTLGSDPTVRARATATSAPVGQAWSSRSRPNLRPPVITVSTPARDTAPGCVFVAPKNGPKEDGSGQDGCVILDNHGQPVWLRLLQNEDLDVMNFKVQGYRREPVLTWWVGHHAGYGQGEYVILDRAYRKVRRFGAGNGYAGDHHEFLITPEGIALITIYHKVPMDLSSMGGSADGIVLDGIAQELDIATREVLFEWHSLEHVGLDESYARPYDYFHINSIDVYDDDHLLISSRHTTTSIRWTRRRARSSGALAARRSCSPPPRVACRSCQAATPSSAGTARRYCRSSATAANCSSAPTCRPKASPTGPSASRGKDILKTPPR
jgi:hypothetical protein